VILLRKNEENSYKIQYMLENLKNFTSNAYNSMEYHGVIQNSLALEI